MLSVIGGNRMAQNVSNSCFIGEHFRRRPSAGRNVAGRYVDSDGQAWHGHFLTALQGRHQADGQASEAIYRAQTGHFRYKKEIDPAGTPQFGLIAEEVEKVNPDLVLRDKEGKPYTVRYDAGERDVAQRVSERAPQGRGIKQRQTTAAKQSSKRMQQQKQIEALTAGLQKVSATARPQQAVCETGL